MKTLTTKLDSDFPLCAGCDKREYNLTYCPLCNVSFCEACAAEHRHACEDCGGTGADLGSLHEPEACEGCGGLKLGESLIELSTRRALAFYQKQQQMEVIK